MVRMKRLGLGLASITALSLALVPVAGAADHFDAPVKITVRDPGPTGATILEYGVWVGAARCEGPTGFRIACDCTDGIVRINMGPAVRR